MTNYSSPLLLERVLDMIRAISTNSNSNSATFDQLAEEVLELHLSLRGKHEDSVSLEWLQVASIAVSALCLLPINDIENAYLEWIGRHHGSAGK